MTVRGHDSLIRRAASKPSIPGQRDVENDQGRVLGPAQGQRILRALRLQQPEVRKLVGHERHDRLPDAGVVIHDQHGRGQVGAFRKGERVEVCQSEPDSSFPEAARL